MIKQFRKNIWWYAKPAHCCNYKGNDHAPHSQTFLLYFGISVPKWAWFSTGSNSQCPLHELCDIPQCHRTQLTSLKLCDTTSRRKLTSKALSPSIIWSFLRLQNLQKPQRNVGNSCLMCKLFFHSSTDPMCIEECYSMLVLLLFPTICCFEYCFVFKNTWLLQTHCM